MTLDEAIKHCEKVARTNERICDTEPSIGLPDIYNHKDEAKKCADDHRQLAEWLKELKAYKEQNGDAISRQEVLDQAMDYGSNTYLVPVNSVKALPSVTPEQRIGRWKRISIDKYVQHAMAYYRCSECGEDIIGEHNYCPSCGAKMEVEGCTKNI